MATLSSRPNTIWNRSRENYTESYRQLQSFSRRDILLHESHSTCTYFYLYLNCKRIFKYAA